MSSILISCFTFKLTLDAYKIRDKVYELYFQRD
jgi:hypothetical protein